LVGLTWVGPLPWGGTAPSRPTAMWKPYCSAYKEHEYLVWLLAAGRGRGVTSADRPGRPAAAAPRASASDRRDAHSRRRSGSAGRRSCTSGRGAASADQSSRPASRSSFFTSARSGLGGATADQITRPTPGSSTLRRVTFHEGSLRVGRASPSPPRRPRCRNRHNQHLRNVARAQVYRERCEQRWAEKAPQPMASDRSWGDPHSHRVWFSDHGSGTQCVEPGRPLDRSWTLSARFRRSFGRVFPASLRPGSPGRNSDKPGPDSGP